MTTALLLLPVAAVLAWIYHRALPGEAGWGLFEAMLFGLTALAVAAWVAWAATAEFSDAGPVYGQLVAAAGAYPILLAGFALGLGWRHLRARREDQR